MCVHACMCVHIQLKMYFPIKFHVNWQINKERQANIAGSGDHHNRVNKYPIKRMAHRHIDFP